MGYSDTMQNIIKFPKSGNSLTTMTEIEHYKQTREPAQIIKLFGFVPFSGDINLINKSSRHDAAVWRNASRLIRGNK